MLQDAALIIRRLTIVCVSMSLVSMVFPPVALAEAPESATPKKSIRRMCGACPEGYATTGVTDAPEICKEGDPTLVQCVPLGANMLAVCGVCPEDYAEIGSSSVPARCGSRDGGRLAQCQLRKMDMSFPDPGQGMKMCPPDCGSTGTPGQQ